MNARVALISVVALLLPLLTSAQDMKLPVFFLRYDGGVFPHRHEGLPRHRVSCRGPPALTGPAEPTHTHLRVVLLSGSRHPGPDRRACAPRGLSRSPHLVRLAPEGWKRDHPPQPSVRIGLPDEPQPELSVSARRSRAAWPA